ncbi:TonB-dependent receptor [Schleiferia thermophila]|jgi:outer membrane receptor protein involved in Fe transport|uniref:Outer membrane receptor protein involved in Fe transport n=1 Tax=Schleiferia thermophila TaxID=884107 RepID=A0A369AAA3_9FLAO|nr:TonB-dependent receptor [Schleiferia thermophila]KFD38649.1 hypothetical protein AT05_09370 [Schleiferia thermophila str. Yellowstone]RCX05226.1 outer membrane receptor protein involved in Fe transport [Schleiferia thermophila]
MISTGRTLRGILWLIAALYWGMAGAQSRSSTGSLRGKVTDAKTGEELIGAGVVIVGTYLGASTDLDGNYLISNIKPGDYVLRVQFIGYATQLITDVSIRAGETKVLNVALKPQTESLNEVTVVGRKSTVNLESAKSEVTFKFEEISQMNVRNVQELVAMQAGVVRSPDGLQIRGARVYETEYIIDGISAQDPLAGTGFGVEVSSNAINSLSLITGGAGAEFGGGSSGVISTTIREGGDRFEISGNWQRDYLINAQNPTSFNTDIVEVTFASPIPGTRKKMTIFNNLTTRLTDEYFGPTANQLISSLLPEQSKLLAPRYSNTHIHTLKLAYQLKPGTKITFTNQFSLSINQNTRMLQIVGFDAILVPGFQYARSQNLDNATTYTHKSILNAVNINHLINKKLGVNISLGRLFTNLRADANGRPFRTETVDQIFDEDHIVTDPVEIFNPGDPTGTYFVLPGNGLVNNGGISPIWHDHYAQEYSIRTKFTYNPNDNINFISFGFQHSANEYQWVDVIRPWVGAPIKINDTTFTPSISIGSSNDIWAVRPHNGGLFVEDKITYKGIQATLGLRLNYWAMGRFADEAVENSQSPVINQVREDYLRKTTQLLGLRWKARLMPRINVSFPVTENNVLYFNYGHSMRMPHPRFVYAGLDPVYQNRSFLANLGNPDIDPEINVSYEVGIKTKVNKDLGFTLTAFNNNRFDYIVSRSVITRDPTGRFVTRTMFINQDYARIAGVELGFNYRWLSHYNFFGNAAYQVARGKSNSARESALQIAQNGEVQLSREQYLAFDRPWNINVGLMFSPDSTFKVMGRKITGFRAFAIYQYTSGFRYTPMRRVGELEVRPGVERPLFMPENDKFLSRLATPWHNVDLKISYDYFITKFTGLTFSIEMRNALNNKNAQIINPVTGRAYEFGDDVPNDWRDPRPEFNGPQERGLDPRNPARYLPPRQMLYGITFRF